MPPSKRPSENYERPETIGPALPPIAEKSASILFKEFSPENNEQEKKAQVAIDRALRLLTQNTHFNKYVQPDFKFQQPRFYLALAAHRSKLDPTKSQNNKFGLFQIDQKILDFVNGAYPQLKFTLKDIHTDSESAFMQKRANIHNAVIGILHWHLTHQEEDQEKENQIDINPKLAKLLKEKGVPKELYEAIQKRVRSKHEYKLLNQAIYTLREVTQTDSDHLNERFAKELKRVGRKVKTGDLFLFVDGALQRSYFVRKTAGNEYRFTTQQTVSTGKRGFGNTKSKTPLGIFWANTKRRPINTRFGGRLYHQARTGTYAHDIVTGYLTPRRKEAILTTSALHLRGVTRPIAFHGTNYEGRLGKKGSGGCVRMANLDSIHFNEIIKKERERGQTKITIYITKTPEKINYYAQN